MKKVFETAFKISGELDKSLPAAVKAAEKSVNALKNASLSSKAMATAGADKLSQYLMKLQTQQGMLKNLATLQAEMPKAYGEYQKQRTDTGRLEQAYRSQAAALDNLRVKLEQLTKAKTQQQAAVRSEQSGVKTLAQQQQQLKVELKALGGIKGIVAPESLKELDALNNKLTQVQSNIDSLKGKLQLGKEQSKALTPEIKTAQTALKVARQSAIEQDPRVQGLTRRLEELQAEKALRRQNELNLRNSYQSLLEKQRQIKAEVGISRESQFKSRLEKATGDEHTKLTQAQTLLAANKQQAEQYRQQLRESTKATTAIQKQINSARKEITAAKSQVDFKSYENVNALSGKVNELTRAKMQLQSALVTESAQLKALQAQQKLIQQEIESKSKGKVPAEVTSRITELKVQLKQVESALKTQRAAVKTAQDAHKQFSEQVKSVKASLKSAEIALTSSRNSYRGSVESLQAMRAELQNQARNMRETDFIIRARGLNTNDIIAAEQRLRSEIDNTTRALERQIAIASSRANFLQAYDRVGQDFQNLQNAVQTAQSVMSPFTSSVDKAADFQRQMSVVKSLTQLDNIRLGNIEKMNSEMSALTAQAKELGMSTQFTATEAAQGQTFLAYAGLNTSEILNALPNMLDLATAAGTKDLGRMSDIVTDIMMAMNKSFSGDLFSAENVKRATDVLSYTFTHSNQNIEQLYETMKYAAPVAAMFGSSIEETAAMTKFMADASVKASQAGTAMRAIMTRLVAPPKAASKAMEENGLSVGNMTLEWEEANRIAAEYGISLNPALKANQQMASVIRQINSNMADLDDQEKMSAFNAIVGRNALSGAINLFENGRKLVADPRDPTKQITALEAFTFQLENAGGSTKLVSDVMKDNFWGAKVGLESAFEAVQISLGDALLQPLTLAAKSVTSYTQNLAKFVDSHPKVVQASAAIAAGFSSIVVAGAGVKLLTSSFAFVGAGLNLLLAPLRGISVALPAAAASWRAFGITFAAFFSAIPSKIGVFSRALLNLPATFYAVARAGFAFAFSPLGAAMLALAATAIAVYKNWDKIAPVFEYLAGVVGNSLTAAFDTLRPAVASAFESFERLMEVIGKSGAGDLLAKSFISALNVIAGVFTTIIDMASNLIAMLADIAGGAADIVANLSKGNFSAAKDSAVKMAEKVWTHGKGAVTAIPNGIESTYSNIEKSLSIYENGVNGANLKSAINPSTQEKALSQSYSTLPDEAFDKQARLNSVVNSGTPDEVYRPDLQSAPLKVPSADRLLLHHSDNYAHSEEVFEQIQSSKNQQLLSAVNSAYHRLPTYTPSFQTAPLENLNTFKVENKQPEIEPVEFRNPRLQDFRSNYYQNQLYQPYLPKVEPVKVQSQSLQQAQNYQQLIQENPTINYSKNIPTYTPSFKANVALPSTTPPPPARNEPLKVEPLKVENARIEISEPNFYRWTPANLPTPKAKSVSYEQVIHQAKDAAISLKPESVLPQSLSTENLQSQLNALSNASQQNAINMQSHARIISATNASNFSANEQNIQALSLTQQAITSTNASFDTAAQSSALFSSNLIQASSSANDSFAMASNAINNVSNESLALTTNLNVNSASLAQATAESLNNASAVNQNSMAAMTSAGNLSNLSVTATNSAGAVSLLSGSASNASGVLSGLAGAAANAISALYNAASSAGSYIFNAVSSFVGIGNNYNGGIYNQGAFLTWFAEKSPEAAIPLDGSDRAINLWQQAGSMLGVYPYQSNSNFISTPKNNIAENYNGGIYAPGGKNIENSNVRKVNGASSNLNVTANNFNTMATAVGTMADVSNETAQSMADSAAKMEKVGGKRNIWREIGDYGKRIFNTFNEHILGKGKNFPPQVGETVTFKSVLEDLTLNSAAKSQRQMQDNLTVARDAKFNDSVKSSKTFETMQRGRNIKNGSITAQQNQSYAPAFQQVFRGDIGGALDSGLKVYSQNASNDALKKAVEQPSLNVSSPPRNSVPDFVVKKPKPKNIFERWGNTISDVILGKSKKPRAYKTDELGNIKNLDIPDYNRITGNETGFVAKDKYRAQMAQLQRLNTFAPKRPNTTGGGIQQPNNPITFKSVVKDMFTPSSVKTQQQAQDNLTFARNAKFNDSIKSSKTFEAMQRGKTRKHNAITAPEKKSYGSAIGSVLRGDIGGGLNSALKVFQNNAELSGLEKAVGGSSGDNVDLPVINAAPKKNFFQKGIESIKNFFGGKTSNIQIEQAFQQAAAIPAQVQAAHAQSLQAINSEDKFEQLEYPVSNVEDNSASSTGDSFTINLTVNIQGNADRNEVTAGINAAIPNLEDALLNFKREQNRRSMTL